MFLKLKGSWSDEFGRKKRKKEYLEPKSNTLSSWSSTRAKKKATKFKYGLSPTTLYTFIPFCGNSPCDTLAYLGPKCNLRLKPWQGALLGESFQENLRKLKQSSWYDAVLFCKSKTKTESRCSRQGWVQGSVQAAWPPWTWPCAVFSCYCTTTASLQHVALLRQGLPARGVRWPERALVQGT